ncbi:MAG: hypothetical protein J1E32_00295 [Treponema sp.]|nr:hypothetical protein [Treponema sp.]
MCHDHYSPKRDDNARLEAQSPVLLRLIRRAVLFMSFETLVLAMFYVSGNLQHFLESNIVLIQHVLGISAIALALLCIAGMVASVWYTLAWRRLTFLLRLIPYGLLLALAVALMSFSLAVDLLTAGLS